MNGVPADFGGWTQAINPGPVRGSRDRPWTQAEVNQLLPSSYRDQLMRYGGYDMPLDSSWAQTQPWFRPPVANQPPGMGGAMNTVNAPPIQRQPAPGMGGAPIAEAPPTLPAPIQPPGQTTSAVTPPPSVTNFPQLGADTGGLSNPLLTPPNVGWDVGKLKRRVTVPQRFQQTY